ncbi:MAG: hypothetical protein JNM43_25485 [Planctomycetaceae bacterium]|nr:hypothetical protein [Planctomycetaceae bacterium]
MRHITLVFVIATLGLSAFVPVVFGASEGFHYVIANLAFERLDASQQNQLVSILKKHPRWEQDFAPVLKGLEGEPHTRRLLGRAAYWPELVKDDPLYGRPAWLREPGATLNLGVRLGKANVKSPEKPDLSRQDLCLSQAILNCRMLIRNDPEGKDAPVAACWLLYLTGAIHQPCNAGSLYVDGVFPKGDQWATQIRTASGESLHSYWDNALGAGFEASRDDALLKDLQDDPQGDVTTLTDDPRKWASESRRIGRRLVYSPRVLAVVESGNTDVVELSPEYIATSRAIMRGRICVAAARLAKVFANDLSPQQLPLENAR